MTAVNVEEVIGKRVGKDLSDEDRSVARRLQVDVVPF